MPQLYFKPLTGLRFIAALMVFVSHLAPRNFSPFINNLLTEFEVGVPIFFVLSGFLIAYRYYDPESGLKGSTSIYFLNRFIRIIPLYLIITIANCIWYNLDYKTSFLNITLLHGFFEEIIFVPVPHTWSLTVECTFYILVPLIFFLIRKKAIVLFQTIIFLITGIILTFIFAKLSLNLWTDYKFMFVLTFFGRCFEFLIGVKLALHLMNSKVNAKQSSLHTHLSIVIFIGMMFVLAFINGLNSYLGIFLHNLILPLFIAWMIYGLIASNNIISRILSTPALQLLGNSSYAFFLIHYGVWQKVMVKYMFIDLFLELLATVIMSIFLFKFIEEPILLLVKKRLLKKY